MIPALVFFASTHCIGCHGIVLVAHSFVSAGGTHVLYTYPMPICPAVVFGEWIPCQTPPPPTVPARVATKVTATLALAVAAKFTNTLSVVVSNLMVAVRAGWPP